MATTGSVPGERASNGPAARRCPLCGRESSGADDCSNCGFDFAGLGKTLQAASASASNSKNAKPVAQNDPIDRWLAGDALEPKDLTDWDRARRWMSLHPRTSALIAAAVLAAVVIPIAALLANMRANSTLRQVTHDYEAVQQECLSLTAEISLKDNALRQQGTTCEQQSRERQDLEKALQQLQADYAKSQQECQAADQRLKDALRETRLSIAEDFSRQARELQHGMPEVSLVLAAKALSITQQEGVAPIPTAFQQVHDLLAPTDGAEMRGHEGPVAQLAASRDGQWLASGDHQGLVRLWNTTSANALASPQILDGHWGRITKLVFTSDNRWLVSGSADSTAHLWRIAGTDGAIAPILLKTAQGRITQLTASENGRWLVIASASQLANEVFVRLWDLQATDIPNRFVDLPNYQGQLCSLAVSRDGSWIATGNNDGSVRLWRLNSASGAVIATDLRMHNDPVRALCFGPDGRSLITAGSRQSGNGSVRAWSLESTDATADAVLADSPRGVDLFAMTANGRWLFTANQEPSLQVRDLSSPDDKPIVLLSGQTGAVQTMALSSNERWLATVGADNTVRLWYLSSKGPTATPITIRTPSGFITSVAFAGKGDWLATGSDRGNIHMWNLGVDDLIRIANARMTNK